MAVKQGFLMYYTKGDAIGTKVSVRYRESGRLSGVVVKRGFTVHVTLKQNLRDKDNLVCHVPNSIAPPNF